MSKPVDLAELFEAYLNGYNDEQAFIDARLDAKLNRYNTDKDE